MVKTRTERKGAPTFTTLIEVLGYNRWRIHMNVARSVDALLAGGTPVTQLRWMEPDGRMMARFEGPQGEEEAASGAVGAATVALQACPGGGGWLAELANMAALY